MERGGGVTGGRDSFVCKWFDIDLSFERVREEEMEKESFCL